MAFSREVAKRKWSADKSAGPLVLLAEWLKKRLIQHAYPCDFIVEWDNRGIGPEENAEAEREAIGVMFVPMGKRPPLAPEFWDAFDGVLRILCYEKNLSAFRQGAQVHLVGAYYVNKWGVIRRGHLPAPF